MLKMKAWKKIKRRGLQQLNKNGNQWIRQSSEITESKKVHNLTNLSNDWDKPWTITLFLRRGDIWFEDLLFAPRRAPSDLFEQKKKLSHIRFYSLRVFVLNRWKQEFQNAYTFRKE
jgi:molecular chaperone HtpG